MFLVRQLTSLNKFYNQIIHVNSTAPSPAPVCGEGQRAESKGQKNPCLVPASQRISGRYWLKTGYMLVCHFKKKEKNNSIYLDFKR